MQRRYMNWNWNWILYEISISAQLSGILEDAIHE
jgi:hypothetical protein